MINTVTISGRLTSDIRVGADGKVANFSIAQNTGRGENERGMFFDVAGWNSDTGNLATRCINNLKSGSHVVVTGRLDQKKNGEYNNVTVIGYDVMAVDVLKINPDGVEGGGNAAPVDEEDPF